MNLDDANQFAIRYKAIWRGGPATEELREHFAEMQLERAQLMLTNMARTTEHPPSIAKLWHAYEQTAPPRNHAYGWPRPDDTGPSISLDDHLAHLQQQASNDDPDAVTELDLWRRKTEKTP